MSRSARTVLLDTNALLDLVVDSGRLHPGALDLLGDPATPLWVSAASAWEVTIKTRQGKLPGGERLLSAWDQTLLDLRAEPLVMDAQDAIRAGSLAWPHRDPFDRMLVAQALRNQLVLATADPVILGSGIVSTLETRR